MNDEGKNLKTPVCHVPQTFITGGAKGADSIPFELVESLKGTIFEGFIRTMGFVPKGFCKEHGKEFTEKYNLVECASDSYSTKDKENVKISHVLIGFIKSDTPERKFGRGTKRTASYALREIYKFPDGTNLDFQPVFPLSEGELYVEAFGPKKRSYSCFGKKPVLLIWNLSGDNWESTVEVVRKFLDEHTPNNLMISGPMIDSDPHIVENGVKLFRKALFDMK